MKKIYILFIACLIGLGAFAQSPEKMSYQAVVRDGFNNLVTSSSVGMQISILQGSTSGPSVYVETQTPTSNNNGLVSIEIGGGTVVSGDFSAIDWANGPYYIQTETDPTGGTSYSITGTSQLLSVPYALHAQSADSLQGFTAPPNLSQIFTGIMDTDTETNFAHNLDASKIVGINVILYDGTDYFNLQGAYYTAKRAFLKITNTEVIIETPSGVGADIIGKPYKVIIFYTN